MRICRMYPGAQKENWGEHCAIPTIISLANFGRCLHSEPLRNPWATEKTPGPGRIIPF